MALTSGLFAREAERSQRWTGIGASAGQAAGPVRVLRSEADLAACAEGDILVMRHATPAVGGAAARAAGLVSETGGLLSHLAVLARELGTPCVTGVPGIVDAVESGAWISLDGSTGTVNAFGASRTAKTSPPISGTHTPILRFGRFSAAFDCKDAHLTAEAVVRVAALALLPVTVGQKAPFRLVFDDNTVLVETRLLVELSHHLANTLEIAPDISARMRASYDETLAWPHWYDADPEVRRLLERFVLLNSLTWAAALVKEQLADRLRRALSAEASDSTDLHEVLLSSLTMPGASYLLAGSGVQQGSEAFTSASLPSEVRTRVKVLRDLIFLTEHKNTRLARLAPVVGRLPVYGALGLSEADLSDDGTADGRTALVQCVVDALPRPELPL